MKPLKVHVISRRTVESICGNPPVLQNDLDNYLSLRPGILSDGACDIFQTNSRSEVQRWAAFELFDVNSYVDSDTVVVFPFWLELFESFGFHNKIGECIDWLSLTYPSNPIVIQWNHDRDAATVPELLNLPENFFVLQFNTSKPTKNDILVPFWTIETRQEWNPFPPRQYRGGFIGVIGGVPVRKRMYQGFWGRSGWYVTEERCSKRDYLYLMQNMDFALCPRGGGLSSYRFWEAIQCGAIPILFADDAFLPFSNSWHDIAVIAPEDTAGDFSAIESRCKEIDVVKQREQIYRIREKLSLAGIQREIHWRISEWLK